MKTLSHDELCLNPTTSVPTKAAAAADRRRVRKAAGLRVTSGLRAGCPHTGTSEHCGSASCDA